MGSGLFPTCLHRNAFLVPTSGRGSVSAHVLGQDVFKGILRHGRAFATQPISDKSLASGSYELRHTRTRLFKRSTTAQMKPSTVTKVAANSILSELVLYFGSLKRTSWPHACRHVSKHRDERHHASIAQKKGRIPKDDLPNRRTPNTPSITSSGMEQRYPQPQVPVFRLEGKFPVESPRETREQKTKQDAADG